MTKIFAEEKSVSYDVANAEHLRLVAKGITELLEQITTLKPESVHTILFSVMLKEGYESTDGNNGTTTMVGAPEDMMVLLLRMLDRLVSASGENLPPFPNLEKERGSATDEG